MQDIDFIESLLSDLKVFFRKESVGRFAVQGADKAEAGDLVTHVDIACQKLIIDRIHETFPEDNILAEESGYNNFPGDCDQRCWIIDPLDGTYNFSRSLSPVFGVSVGVAVSGKSIAAGVLLPELSLLYLAVKGGGAFCNGERLSVSTIDRLGEAKMEIDFSELSRRQDCIAVGSGLMDQASQVRSTGSTVVALCSIAHGLTELFIHPCPKPWDYAAGMLLIEEAGGCISRFNGDAINLLDRRDDILATNRSVHDAALGAVLAGSYSFGA